MHASEADSIRTQTTMLLSLIMGYMPGTRGLHRGASSPGDNLMIQCLAISGLDIGATEAVPKGDGRS
jgi:hypothetical protein